MTTTNRPSDDDKWNGLNLLCKIDQFFFETHILGFLRFLGAGEEYKLLEGIMLFEIPLTDVSTIRVYNLVRAIIQGVVNSDFKFKNF